MAKNINSVILEGRLVRDIETREVGKAYALSGCIAVNRSYKKNDEWVEVASFINIKLWVSSPKQLDFYKDNLKKGVLVVVQGQLIVETYEKDGKKNSFTYVLCDIVQSFNSGKGSGSSSDKKEFSPTEGFPENFPF